MKIIKLFLLSSILLLSFGSVFSQLEWVPFEGKIPTEAVIGGIENNNTLPVCRCDYNGAMHPGKVVANKCNIGYGGVEKAIASFEVLVNRGIIELHWQKSEGSLPSQAVQAGTERGLPLYVGRAFHKGNTHPGKVFKSGSDNKYICNLGYGGKEIVNTTFEVLVQSDSNTTAKHQNHDNRCKEAVNKNVITAGFIGMMKKNTQINEGQSLVSSNLKYGARVTDDGRLIVEEILDHAFCDDGRILVFKGKEVWANTTEGQDPNLDYFLKFQEDGNLCIYSEQKGFVWCSMCNDKDGHHLELTGLGYLEVVNGHGFEIWPQ